MEDMMSLRVSTALRQISSNVSFAITALVSLMVVLHSQASAETWRAIGHEPSWSLTREGGQMTLVTDFGATRVFFAVASTALVDSRTVVHSTSSQGSRLQLTIAVGVCVDSMTGMPRPHQVTVAFNGRHLAGCGGDPRNLLQSDEWKVRSLDGTPTLARSRITLAFAEDGTVSGNATCNRFSGAYEVTGEGLRINHSMSSMMPCDPALMQQEQLFLSVLQKIARFTIEADGALALRTNDGQSIIMDKST